MRGIYQVYKAPTDANGNSRKLIVLTSKQEGQKPTSNSYMFGAEGAQSYIPEGFTDATGLEIKVSISELRAIHKHLIYNDAAFRQLRKLSSERE